MRTSPITIRTYFLLVLFLALRAFGNLCLAWGTKHLPEKLAAEPLAYLRSMMDPFVALGIAMLIVALLVRLALLSVADLELRTAHDGHWLRAGGAAGKVLSS